MLPRLLYNWRNPETGLYPTRMKFMSLGVAGSD
jgi:hypothetical protein